MFYHNDEDFPTSDTFIVTSSASLSKLVKLSPKEISIILPTLARTILRKTLYENSNYNKFQHEIQKILRRFEEVNFIYKLLNIDFHIFKDDILKNQHLRLKHSNLKIPEETQSNTKIGLSLQYEGSSPLEKIRIVITEIMHIMSKKKDATQLFPLEDAELFQCRVHVDEISNALCVAYAELPFLLPITEVAEALLRVKHGPWILCKLLTNNPDCFDEVCLSILMHATSSDESEIETRIRMNTLGRLCKLNPSYKKTLRMECVSLCKLFGLAIELSLNQANSVCTVKENDATDIVSFFTGLLLAGDVRTKEWIAEYIKTAQKDHKDNALTLFKKQLLLEMDNVIKSLTSCQNSNMELDNAVININNDIMHGISIMRLFCSLKSMSGFKFTPVEADILLNLITSPTPLSQLGTRYVTVALCTMVACSFLISTVEQEEKVKGWLRKLIDHSSAILQQESNLEVSYGEILLLIAIHFHGNQLEPIVDLICSTLGIKVKTGSLTKLKILFTQEVFQEKVIAEHAVTVQVTNNLSKTHSHGFLPAHCILQLMKSRIFTKYNISVKEWLFKQICSCSTPIHPILSQLIDAFVFSIVTPINVSRTKHQRMVTLKPFAEEDILSVFSEDGSTVSQNCVNSDATKILLMLYVLKYQDVLLNNIKTLISNPKAPRQYSALVYSTIPLKQLLLKTRVDEKLYGDLYPPLLKLLTTYYPQLCLVEDWIVEEEISSSDNSSSFITDKELNARRSFQDITKSIISIEKDFANISSCPQKMILKISQLLSLSPSLLSPYEDLIINLLPKLLEPTMPRKMQMLVCQAWIKLNTLNPNRIWFKTVNKLHKPTASIDSLLATAEYTDEEIQKDPLIVLRCDMRVYRCPPVFDVLLRVLNGYLTASKSSMNHHLLSNPIISSSRSIQEIRAAEQEREELKSALISAQESAAIQILLEVCLPTQEEKENQCYSLQSVLREIQCSCCCYIHQSFIKAPGVAKLIHFQGYPADLLPITVAGVPSIHICLDFIPELLNQTHLEKQLFAVQLTSHLAVQYPIPKSYSISKHVIDRLTDLLLTLPAVKRNQFFVPSLVCLIRIGKAFPPLREDITNLILKLGNIASSQLDKTSFITAVPHVEEITKNPIEPEDDIECDIEEQLEGESNKININETGLMGDNPAYNRDMALKTFTSADLVTETKRAFKEISNLCFSDKLVLT